MVLHTIGFVASIDLRHKKPFKILSGFFVLKIHYNFTTIQFSFELRLLFQNDPKLLSMV